MPRRARAANSPPAKCMKAYDRAYFDRWYRHPTDAVSSRESLERKIRLAVSVTEYVIGRPIRSVLDVGCGEAPWFPVLRRLRRDVRYTGIDASTRPGGSHWRPP